MSSTDVSSSRTRTGSSICRCRGLSGAHQIDNAGNAVATVRVLNDARIGVTHIEEGLRSVEWPARMQRLADGRLTEGLPRDVELWLDGGHNPAAGEALAEAFRRLDGRAPRPLVLDLGDAQHEGCGRFHRALRRSRERKS